MQVKILGSAPAPGAPVVPMPLNTHDDVTITYSIHIVKHQHDVYIALISVHTLRE